MNLLRFFIITFILINNVYAAGNVAFINIEFLIQNTNIGKTVIKKIDTNNSKKTNYLQNRESELKKKENEIKKKQNIISDDELKKEIELLKNDVNAYNKEKQKIVNDLKKFKVEELNLLISQFNDIINEYMNQNSIDIVLDKKNLYMGKISSDITKNIVEQINEKIK